MSFDRAAASRRHFLAGAIALPFYACFAPADAATGRSFIGNRRRGGSKGDGGEGIRATSGLTLRNCTFRNLGNGGVRVARPINGLTIENCHADNLYRFLEVSQPAKGGSASLSNFTLRKITARNLDHGFSRIRYGSHTGVIEDVVAYASARCDDYCVGFQLDGAAHDIRYIRAEAHGFRESARPRDKYWNGDGFSDERGNRDIAYIDCLATGCSDGGFDLKSAGVRLSNCLARANKRNFRLWGSGTLIRCTSENPKHYGGTGGTAHFAFHGNAGRFVLDRPVVRAARGNTAPVFLIETKGPVTIEIRNADIDAPSAPLFKVQGPPPKIIWVPAQKKQKIRVATHRQG